jgi:hypothetical protein
MMCAMLQWKSEQHGQGGGCERVMQELGRERAKPAEACSVADGHERQAS